MSSLYDLYKMVNEVLPSMIDVQKGNTTVTIEKIVDGGEDTETVELVRLHNLNEDVAFILSTVINGHTYDYCLGVSYTETERKNE